MKDKHQLWLNPLTNEAVAERLDEVAESLEAQRANAFRVQAYRRGARTLRDLNRPVSDLMADAGEPGLLELPGIGKSLARAIDQLVHTGKLPLLERLRGESAPERIFTTVAEIGRVLAHRIHEVLDIEGLVELQAAAWDGRLQTVPGFGRKRIQAVRDALAGRLRPRPPLTRATGSTDRPYDQPLVDELLDIDSQYRRLAEQDRLPRIAPRRFNPNREAWLPILHTQRHGRHYTALYSNTARAHEFGMTHDWIVIYRDDHDGDGQWTVITATFGPHKGQRIVRGLLMESEDARN